MSLLAVERATLATWRAGDVEEIDGWVHCASGGVSGRVNAVWPLAFTGANAAAAIRRAEVWYGARGLPCVFKITDGLCAPDDLPDHLAAHAYAPAQMTAIMTRALGGDEPGDAGVLIAPAMSPPLEQALRAAAADAADFEERRAIAARAPSPAAFALLPGESGADAVGMSAIAAGCAGIFLMRTRAEARRRGHARRVLRALLAWAQGQGATIAFLQVESDNRGACDLYLSEGFRTLSYYRYWRLDHAARLEQLRPSVTQIPGL